MSAHFRWYPSSEDVVVPWSARYSFPSQANKSVKMTPRIPPKNGANFLPGNVIRLEFPAQGFANAINTMLEFDVTLFGCAGGSAFEQTRFQNNIQSIFSRVRLMYGSTPLEDIINYNQVVRNLTEHTSTNQICSIDQLSLMDGVGGVIYQNNGTAASGYLNVRKSLIQGIDNTVNTGSGLSPLGGAASFGNIPNQISVYQGQTLPTNYCTRRYQVNLALGLLMQDKLLPVKFMASQLAIEITLEQPAACIYSQYFSATSPPTYGLTNVNLIPEILEFDASYDQAFLSGLEGGGVPLKFSSWHTFVFSIGGSSVAQLLIQERSRSVKALFACQRRQPYSINTDSGATFFDTCTTDGNTMLDYQWRIGARYFPGQPVQLGYSTSTGYASNGGAEAYAELQKALNVVGDYRLSTSTNTLRWAECPTSTGVTVSGGTTTKHNELDYACTIVGRTAGGQPKHTKVENNSGSSGNLYGGLVGSANYISAIDLETSSGVEISGLNAEEQSDISFIAHWSMAQDAGFAMEVYSYYDAMILIRPNNVVELVQ